jgi:type I restriction enzyme S subunit
MVRGFPKPNDIFFVTEGHTMGFVALNTRDDNFALAQRMITLQPAVHFDTKYFYYYMLSNYFQRLIRINATGATAKGMKSSRLRNLPLPFPSLQEQRAIVEKLDSLKAEIEKLNHTYQQELNNIDEFKLSILQEAFNGNL